MRDEFSKPVKELLGRKVAFKCSNPKCRMLTIGPNEDQTGVISIGVAAHIHGASVGGPRYDDSMTNDERSAESNGIWLCQSCSKLIDSDVKQFPKKLLLEWKTRAEREAGEQLNKQLGANLPFGENTDREAIKPNGFYEKKLGEQVVRYYLEGDFLHVEHEQVPGVVAYYVLDPNGNVVNHRFPYPLEEYSVFVEPSLILQHTTERLPNGNYKDVYFCKWGMVGHFIWNSNNQLVWMNINRNGTINHAEKKIMMLPPKFN